MIRPSEVDVSEHFWDSPFQNHEKEVIARNIAIVLKTAAFTAGEDEWIGFSLEEYEAFRAEDNPDSPVSASERWVIDRFVADTYLDRAEDGTLSVTNNFLRVLGKYANQTAQTA